MSLSRQAGDVWPSVLLAGGLVEPGQVWANQPNQAELPAGDQVTPGPAGLGFYLPEPACTTFQSGPIVGLHDLLVSTDRTPL